MTLNLHTTALALIEAGEKATPGTWKVKIPDRGYCDNYVVSDHESVKPDEKNRFKNMIANCEDCKNGENDANYIALASPEAVIALAKGYISVEEKMEKADELHDSAYIAGMKVGWNLGIAEDTEKFQSIVDTRLKQKRNHKALKSLPQQKETP